MASKKILKAEDYKRIEDRIDLKGEEDYVVLAHKRHNTISFSIHVFARQPMPKEMVAYEEESSRLKFRGQRAEIEGSQIIASRHLYDALIARSYDVPLGRVTHAERDRDGSIKHVPMMVKREAIRTFLGNVMSAADLAEEAGEETAVTGK